MLYLLEFFLESKPSICVHAEPLRELYDEKNLMDYLAMRYHEKRNYLVGLVPRLKELEMDGRIEILHLHRVMFGSLFHEGYSLLIWRPL